MTTCPLPPFPILPVGGVPAWLLGPSCSNLQPSSCLTPSRVQIGAELIRQASSLTRSSSPIPTTRQLRFPATAAHHGVRQTDTAALATCCHPVTGAVPRTSYRGTKGHSATHRVSPQQAPKCQFVAEPAGSRSRSRISPPTPFSTRSTLSTGWRGTALGQWLKIGCPVAYSKTECYNRRWKE